MANSNKSELKVTQQHAPTMALKFMLDKFKNITITQLEKEYGLNRSTLYRIKDGECLTRCSNGYMHVFVRIINEKRRSAQSTGNKRLGIKIDHLLRDLTLVQNGVPTDVEIFLAERKKKLGV